MPEPSAVRTAAGPQLADVDLSGARVFKVKLRGASFRRVDLSGADLRDFSLAGASIFGGEIEGLHIDGVDIAPLVEAELTRRYPARARLWATDPEELRTAWTEIQHTWTPRYDRVAAMPTGTADLSVAGEWSFAETLRHLIFATDGWLGAVLGRPRFHPWGMPFSELEEFAGPASDLGVDVQAQPSYAEVLELRADRVARVSDYLAEVRPEQLAEECEAPVWDGGARISRLRCLWVIMNEELEHLRFADRDLDAIDASDRSSAKEVAG